MTISNLIKSIQDKLEEWTCADWTHEYELDEKRVYVDLDGLFTNQPEQETDLGRVELDIALCDGDQEDCSYCAQAKEDAGEASERAKEAIRSLLEGDLDEALELLQEASRLEAYYGDDPTWGKPVQDLEALIAE